MEIIGKIHSISEIQQVSATFSKREFIVETDEQFKQYILLQVVKDKCSVLDAYKVGQEVKVDINLKGRLWTNPHGEEKCFNTLECWRISKTENTSTQSAVENYQAKQDDSDSDNLPF